MDTVTYPDQRVESFLAQHFIPVKIPVKQSPDLVAEYRVHWSPNVVVADEEGRIHYRVEGYRPPEDMRGRLELGLARFLFDRKDFEKARRQWEETARSHPESEIGAEALYWCGVAHYKSTQDPSRLLETWKRLSQEFPRSEWAQAANVPKRH
jgi:hypothetical protein